MSQLIKKFAGAVSNGKIFICEKEKWHMLVSQLEGKKIVMTLAPFRKPRSNQENKYMWGVVCKMIAEHIGEDSDWVHDNVVVGICGRQLWHQEIAGKMIEMEIFIGTSKLSTVEFEERMAAARMWAAKELNLYVPLPNEVDLDALQY